MVLLAHVGHWLIWVLYAVPVLIAVEHRNEGSDPL